MKANQTVASDEWQVTSADSRTAGLVTRHSSRVTRSAFSLIEVMVVVALMSLIVLALMAVFTSTQRAFRSAVTQTDVLEGSRAAMDLIATDLRGLTPSEAPYYSFGVNFFVTNNASYSQPLIQSLPGSVSNTTRKNLQQEFFILSHQNTKWWGVGYAIALNSSGSLYSLYRLQWPSPPGTNDPTTIFTNQIFQSFFQNPTNGGSHLLDGVVHFVVRAYDPNGIWIPYGFAANQTNSLKQTVFFPLTGGEAGFLMYSNDVPASVELEMGVLEDRTLQRAESLPNFSTQTNYLYDKSGNVHVFRQRVNIPNVDTTAYP
jgi:type II secretory pathway pseudopilin PulG